MIRCRFTRWVAGLVGLGGLSLVVCMAAKGDDPPAKRSDPTKMVVIERPVNRIVKDRSAPIPIGEFKNPKVQPGKVPWHPTFAAACEAARKSGKPVLLFQMMGKLDDQFC